MKKVHDLISHLNFIIAGIFITFLILDINNPTMEFVNNSVSRKLLWAFCLISITNSLLTIFTKNYQEIPIEETIDNSQIR